MLSLLWSRPVFDIFHSMKLHSVDNTEDKIKLPPGCPKVCQNVYHSHYWAPTVCSLRATAGKVDVRGVSLTSQHAQTGEGTGQLEGTAKQECFSQQTERSMEHGEVNSPVAAISLLWSEVRGRWLLSGSFNRRRWGPLPRRLHLGDSRGRRQAGREQLTAIVGKETERGPRGPCGAGSQDTGSGVGAQLCSGRFWKKFYLPWK